MIYTHRNLIVSYTSPRAWSHRPRPRCHCHIDRLGCYWAPQGRRIVRTEVWHCPACQVLIEVTIDNPLRIATYPFVRPEPGGASCHSTH